VSAAGTRTCTVQIMEERPGPGHMLIDDCERGDIKGAISRGLIVADPH